MDTSSQYVKMCEKIGEIQKGWKLKELDQYVVISPSYRDGYITGEYIDGYYRQFREETWLELIIERHSIGVKDVKIIWLPRQDQLQEMVTDFPDHPHTLIARFYDFDLEYCAATWTETSMEQLWLAFVMHEKYQKIWDSKKEDWVND